MEWTMRRSDIGAGLLGLVLALAPVALGPARADEPQEPDPAATSGSKTEALPVSIAGMAVAVDTVTGRLRPPTPAEARELARSLSRRGERPRVPRSPVAHRDGMLSLVVGTDYLEFLVGTLDPSGRLVAACVDGEPSATLGAPQAPALEEE
jgi:hypothetical protein